MENVGWLVLAILAAYGCAVVVPLLRRSVGGSVGDVAGWGLVPIVWVWPLLIPSANLGWRAAAAFVSGDITFKIVEFLRHTAHGEPDITLHDYYRFLIPFPVLAAVYPDQRRRLSRPESPWPQLLRLCGGVVGVAVALLANHALSRLALVRSSFALNHAAMLPAFVLAIESVSRALCGLERLAGFDTTPIIHNAFRSRTISEFWRRYNGRIHDWLYRNVFLRTGGRRTPVRSLFLVYIFSGLFHEVAFAVATSRVTGYQFAFFTLQAPAALASGRLERLARRGGIAGKIVAHGLTILFLAVTSVLFFDGVSKVFPFIYASPSPLP